jgi:phospholipase/carboxylesterase
MSGRLLGRSVVSAAPPEDLTGLPLMVVHGTGDTVIPIQFGRDTRDALASLPVSLDYREYDMAHHVTGHSIADINSWLGARLDAGDWRTTHA